MKKYKENASFTKKSTAERIVYIVVFVLFFLYAAELALSFPLGLLSSLKGVDEYLDSPFSLPVGMAVFQLRLLRSRCCATTTQTSCK